MTVEFNSTGIVTDTVSEIKRKIDENLKINLKPYLQGEELLTDDSSMLGRITSTISVPIFQNNQIIQPILSSLSLNDAEDVALDNLAQTIYNQKRLRESQAQGDLEIQARISTNLPVNSKFANVNTGDIFATEHSVVFDLNGASGIRVTINNINQTYEIKYAIHGYLSTSPVIKVTSPASDKTKKEVADRIVSAVTTQSTYLDAVSLNDDTVVISVKDKNLVADWSITPNLSSYSSFKPARVLSTTTQTKTALPNQVTSIRSGVSGLLSATNHFIIDPSNGVEQDEEFRNRLRLYSVSSVGSRDALTFALNSIRGVTYVNTETTRDGCVIVVMGGNENDIAMAIRKHVSDGIWLLGDIVKNVKDLNGSSQTVRFSRPKKVPIQISMSLIIYPTFPMGGITQIKQALVEYFNNLQVGEDVYFSRLYEPINSIKGFSVKDLKYSRLGVELGNAEQIVINSDEKATITAEDIRIGGQ